MYLIPIVCRQLRPGLCQCWLLLERNGTHAMIADASTFAEENGLETNGSPIVAAGFTLLDIKLTPVLADFYLWADVVAGEPMREVWRPFLWSTGSLNLAAGLDLSLGDGLTVASVLEAYFKPRRVESIDK